MHYSQGFIKGAGYTEEVLAKYLKSKHLKTKPPATSPDWSKVESYKKKEVMGYVMCLHEFYSSDGESGDALVIEN